MDFAIFFLGGVAIGVLLHMYAVHNRRVSGTFVMDFTDPEKDVCRLEMNDNLEQIYSMKQIVLNVKVYEDDSQQ